eukprot:TRINITY_DN12068_c0_g1_i1.p1 TRINITY_DN12068_c0_g1~~TRINITY_DN12068_c0_g1_i1.p1  ORF type:complete len:449 (+),score=79.17 TRINITY_DN12068_c0_g1_i1:69-1415(+)
MLTTFSRLRKLGSQSSDNEAVVFHNPSKVMDTIWDEIDSSKEEVLLLSYILKNDDVGQETLRRLTEAAKRGVRIQLIYDSAGNITGRSKLTAPLTEAGGDVVCFRPFWQCLFTYIKSGFDFRESPALRNHRKIIIIDNKVGFIGGLNIGNEYAGRPCTGLYLTAGKTFKDCMVKLTGPCVADLRKAYEDVLITPFSDEVKENRSKRPSWSDWNESLRNDPPAALTKTVEISRFWGLFKSTVEVPHNDNTQIISCNPWTRDYSIQLSIVETCRAAKKRIWITTPYYYPPTHIKTAIEDAARRGVDVRILVGGPNSTDPPMMKYVQKTGFVEALTAGCRIYEYNPTDKEVMHSKSWSVDGEYCSIGSYNLDLLSDKILESNVAFHNTNIASELEQQFLVDTANSVELSKLKEDKLNSTSLRGRITFPIVTGFYHFTQWCFKGDFDVMKHM